MPAAHDGTARLGRKSKRGFYDYSKTPKKVDRSSTSCSAGRKAGSTTSRSSSAAGC
jgi:3-hydroxyacyl-CoA dehydrogenase